ncbi:MAG: hypothetical protein KA163_09275 [Bacteroidia bacterium]|nr:hypothetical protein [Bacteroidia bacterium]
MADTIDSLKEEIKQIYKTLDYTKTASYLSSSVSKIIDLLKKMEQIESRITGQSLEALFHTLHKEVEFCHHHEKLMHKRNAAKIRKKEFQEQMNDAIGQINVDINFDLR